MGDLRILLCQSKIKTDLLFLIMMNICVRKLTCSHWPLLMHLSIKMTYTNFKIDTDNDGIAVVTWDMPDKSMNVIDLTVMDEWEKIVDSMSTDENIKGVVLASGKKTFGAGADLSMLQDMLGQFRAEEAKDPAAAAQLLFDNAYRLNLLLRKQETSGKPFVAAINGQAIGGCLEMCLACHARVIADDAKVSLPEVKVGLFPGGGGTQRTKAQGLTTEVAPEAELINKAKELINGGLKGEQPWDVKGYKFPGGHVYTPAGFQLFPPANAIYRRETQDNYPGARAIMKCVYEGMLVPFDTALKIESRVEQGCTSSNSIGKLEVNKIGVIGAGLMGAGIAYVSAKAGIDVVLIDRDQASADRGKSWSETTEDKAISKKRSTAEKKEAILSKITATDDYKNLSDVDMVIEAVFEDSEVKKTATEMAEAHMPEDAIFASNTSTIPISDLAKFSKRPEQFVGIHFFSPVNMMMLVETIKGDKTVHKILHQTIRDLGEGAVEQRHIDLVDSMVEKHDRLGKKNGKGFYDYPDKPAKKHLWPGLKDMYPQQEADAIDRDEIKNRFHATIAVEAARCVEEGVVTDVREADVGSILGFGFAPFTGGALSYIDGMGSTKFVEMLKDLHAKYGDQFKPNALLLEMAKSNEKFYERFDPTGTPSKKAA
ncbi:Fatty acid oxidation complex subunit alpha [Nymphon striatum]|nr:Fatty acid oxidation complex subunit alpha [Nymphon striatum]